MEVETHTIPSFELNSTGRPLCTQPGSSESMENDVLQSPMKGHNSKCDVNDDESFCEWSNDSAAMKVQQYYRGYRTRRLLADTAVAAEEFWWQAIDSARQNDSTISAFNYSKPAAEEFWWQAIDFARLNHSTISFFNFSKPETAASRWNRVSLNASKVGQGLSVDAKAQKLALQHWIEAIDPRHRYGHSLHLYYEEWCKADAGQPFFYWLDIGDGKEVDLPKCPRSKLRQQCIKYLGTQEREHYEYVVDKGKIVHQQTGIFLDTKKGLPGAKWIFVMSTCQRLYAGEKKKGCFHHSSFLAGGATLAAGRLVVDNGTLKSISAYSGHYRPTDERLDSFLSFLKDNGVNLDEVEIRKASDDAENNDDGKLSREDSTKVTTPEFLQPDNTTNIEDTIPVHEEIEVSKFEGKNSYRRTLSGGLQSPRADVPKKSILERINSKKAAKSYQLGHQLTLKWSTGAGPRIGCIVDYPPELRFQALEFTSLSPRNPPTPPIYRRIGSLVSPLASPSQLASHGDAKSSESYVKVVPNNSHLKDDL